MTVNERYLAAKRALFDRFYEERLNARQREAVCTEKGALLVLAGAGSGKTTVLVRRIVHLIRYGDAYETDFVPEGTCDEDVSILESAVKTATPREIEELLSLFIHNPCPPYGVLAITFTNKAANEIKSRLSAAFDSEELSREIWAGTFHSICLRILRSYPAEAGLPSGFSIYDADDSKRIVTEIMREMAIDEKVLSVKTVLKALGDAKNRLLTPEEYREEAKKNEEDETIGRIYAAYQKRLNAAGALDFDDIIMKTVKLLESCEAALNRYASKFRYVSIDEYQDTNFAQFRLAKLLSSYHGNIMVVGDDDQSIYRFRGATVENILSFERSFPGARVVKLEQNYRSTKTILAAANAVISHNEARHDKHLWCDKAEGEKITLCRCDNQTDEALYIKDTITHLVAGGRRYRDIAILYRMNEMSRSIEGVLAKSGIPYRIFGGQRFYDRKEIRDLVAYLHVIENPGDDLRLQRIINEPKRKIGETTVSTLLEMAKERGTSVFSIVERAADEPSLSKVANALLGFASLIHRLREKKEEGGIARLVDAVYHDTGYYQMLTAEGEQGETRKDNVGELISAAAEYEKREELPTLYGFLEEITLVSEIDKYDEGADAVSLMTMHSAKGLEFPVVFLPAMEEGLFPGTRSMYNESDMAEERRLAYVAITRAKERLYLSVAGERLMYGQTSTNPLSRFVEAEIPKELIEDKNHHGPLGSMANRLGIGRGSTAFGRGKPFGTPRPTYGGGYSGGGYGKGGDARGRGTSGYGSGDRSGSGAGYGSGDRYGRPKTAETPAVVPKRAESELPRFAKGDRVAHTLFGKGTVESAREMGGDVLYEILFDSGDKKRLMGTYAKLKKE